MTSSYSEVLSAAREVFPTYSDDDELDSLQLMQLLVHLEKLGIEAPDPQAIVDPTIAGVAASATQRL